MKKTKGIPIEKAGQFAAQHLTSGQNQCCQVFHSDQGMGGALVLSADRYALYFNDMLKVVIFVLLGSINFFSWAQSCIPDYIDFYSQSQVDSFQINYPGCIEIEGDVYISGDDISNLSGLSVLTSIGGHLSIEYTSSLITLFGLNNLSSIGEGLSIKENETLINLVGLNGLVSIGGSLIILENPSLLHLTGLDNLTSIGDDFNIGCSNYYWTGNPLLTNLTGLNSLSSIGNSLRIWYNHGLTDLFGIENLISVENVRISSNNNLSSLNGLQGLTNVDGLISITWNDSLNSLNGLNNLANVGNLTLHGLPNLTNLMGLEQLDSVTNNLSISYNSINSLIGLNSLTSIGGKLIIEDDDNLDNLSGLESLTQIGAGLKISWNSSLSNLDALSSLDFIGGDLILESNALTSLIGLSGVTSIDGNLVITNTSTLTSLAGIENINPASIKSLNISWLYSLTDCAYENICEYLSDPHGVVDIYRNCNPCNNPAQIAYDCGFTMSCLPNGNYHFLYQSEIDSFQTDYPGCTDLKGSLIIHGGYGGNTGNYTNLNGLSVVTSIDGMLAIFGAYYLPSLSGIDNINGASITDLIITNCPYLSECEVQSICEYLAAPNGEVEIYENAYGCNSPEQVQAKCDAVIIKENYIEPLYRIFPNPASQYLFIENKANNGIDKLIIYNILGQLIKSQFFEGPLVDISELGQGFYILEIIAGNSIQRFKFKVGK